MRFIEIVLCLVLPCAIAAHAAAPPSAPRYGMAMKEFRIQLPDGVHLAADLYMPTGGAADERFPVLLKYLPYRKTESRSRDWPMYSYFVQRGYIVAAVDIRGTGNSEGTLIPYEYSEIEQQDGEVLIDWLSKQAWSNGNVGMFGISWGGFNSIQMARRNPPALKAIIAVDATEDLYQEDVHFMDGIIHVDSWEMSMDVDNTRPGAPDYKIDDANFRERFDTQPWMMTYKRQQRDGPFWDRASLKGHYDELRIPAFFIGGWYDGYRDSVPRMLEKLKGPVKAMVGPWSHAFPHDAYPKSTQIEWRNEAVRWFDKWLKGRDTGIMDEPRFAVYVRQWHPPGPVLADVPGAWRWEDGWPIKRIQNRVFNPQPNHTLSEQRADAATHLLRYVPTIGVEAGGPVMWWGDAAHDQRPTDAFSLVYDSDPLDKELEILGLPKALLKVSADSRQANWFARLSDVAPDGTVTQVTGAGYNGMQRQSAREPKAMIPGQEFAAEIEMHFTSWVFPKGHRIRLAVNNAMWPMLWPSPYPTTTTLRLGGKDGSQLVLPVVPHADRPIPQFLPPVQDPVLEGFASLESGTASGYGEVSSVDRNPQTGAVKVIATNGGGSRFQWGTERYTESIEHRSSDAHPENTSVVGRHHMQVELKDRSLSWDAELSFRSDLHNFYYDYTRKLSENGKLVREKTWTDKIPRDGQ